MYWFAVFVSGAGKKKRGGSPLDAVFKNNYSEFSVKKENQLPYVAISFYREVWTLSDIFPS